MFDFFIDMFKDLTPILWASQISGIIGFIIITISYQFKKKTFLILCCVACCFFILEQLLAGLYTNVGTSSCSLVRNILILYYEEKKHKKLPVYFNHIAMIILFIISTFVFINGDHSLSSALQNYSLLVIYAIGAYTVTAKNYYVVKAGAFLNEGGYMVYYIINRLPFSIFRQVVLTTSVVVSTIVLAIKDIFIKKQNKASN